MSAYVSITREGNACPAWCDEDPCRGEHSPGNDWMQDMRVTEGLSGSTLLSVFPTWDELDGLLPQVSIYLDNDTQVYLTPGQARDMAEWLLKAADLVDVRKLFAG